MPQLPPEPWGADKMKAVVLTGGSFPVFAQTPR